MSHEVRSFATTGNQESFLWFLWPQSWNNCITFGCPNCYTIYIPMLVCHWKSHELQWFIFIFQPPMANFFGVCNGFQFQSFNIFWFTRKTTLSGTVNSTIQNHGFTILSPGPWSPRLTCTLRRHWPTTSPGSAGRPEIGWKIPWKSQKWPFSSLWLNTKGVSALWMWLESLICWEYAVAATNNKHNIELLQWYASINEVRKWCTVCSCGKLTDLWGFNVQFRVCAMQCNLMWKPPK